MIIIEGYVSKKKTRNLILSGGGISKALIATDHKDPPKVVLLINEGKNGQDNH